VSMNFEIGTVLCCTSAYWSFSSYKNIFLTVLIGLDLVQLQTTVAEGREVMFYIALLFSSSSSLLPAPSAVDCLWCWEARHYKLYWCCAFFFLISETVLYTCGRVKKYVTICPCELFFKKNLA
jgi:hypothetical protein